MPETPHWLLTLLRVREQRRDAAFQTLAHSLQSAGAARVAADSVAAEVARLKHDQQSNVSGRVDVARGRQLHQHRDDLKARLTELRSHQAAAEDEVRQAQTMATARETEVEVLRRLQDRQFEAHRVEQRRRGERNLLEIETARSLCNGEASAYITAPLPIPRILKEVF